MPPHYLINKRFSIMFGHVSRLHKNEVSRLSDRISNKLNGIMQFPGPGHTNHKVHINSLALTCLDINQMGKTSKIKVFGLNLLAIGALLQKHRNISLHTFRPIDLLEIMIHLGGTWMTGIPGSMSLYNNIRSQIINIGYTQYALISKNAIPPKGRMIHLAYSTTSL
ncbi:hypothetical protein EJD97_002720 [Solanum chilense]|uniref:Uncharacterized protein n=1 Tax=Solanum chilense TaxID=4083 RepID=A0A6N2CBI5_SOLCI|nr:hypothetical protein EJD97_002720 [Solanum chilense]